MTFDIWFFAFAIPAIIFAGVSKGGFGSGASFAAASILALVLEPGLVLGVLLPPLMLVDFASLPPYWKRWRWPETRLLILGGIPGVALGALLFTQVDGDVFRVLIGLISVLFVIWQLAQSRGWKAFGGRQLPLNAGLPAGIAAGFTSFVSHAGGPVAAVYLLSRGMSKTEYQATTVVVFWIVNIGKFVSYSYLGMFTAQTALANVYLAPFALLGTWLGVKAHRVIPERTFFTLTYILLTVTGTKLIWDGLT